MNFGEEHLIFKNTVRNRLWDESKKDVREDIKEMIRQYERHDAPFAWEFVREMAKLGLCGINIPEEHGGQGADNLCGVIAMAEMSRIWSGAALTLAVGNSLVGYPIMKFGSEDQKKTYLLDLAAGKILGSFCLTEPGHGSDSAHLQASAQKVYDGWLIKGQKHFITNAPIASFFVVFARTNKEYSDHRGTTAFLMPVNKSSSLTIEEPDQKEGLHAAHMSRIFFDNHFICHCSVLGQEGKGFMISMATLNHGRNWIAAQACGLLERALELAVKHADNRVVFEQKLTSPSDIRDRFIRLAVALDVSRILLYYSAYLEDQGKDFAPYASLAKLFSSEELKILKGEAQYIHGGAGYVLESEITRVVMDGDVQNVYEGASAIQKKVLLGAWLKNKLLLPTPLEFLRPTMHLLKDDIKKHIGNQDILKMKDQRFPFQVANIFPLVAAWDILQREFIHNWPKEFFLFQDPLLLNRLLSERIWKEWPSVENRKNGTLWDEAGEYVIKRYAS